MLTQVAGSYRTGAVLSLAGQTIVFEMPPCPIVSLVDGEIHICSWQKNLERAQAIARQYISDNVSPVGELIAERRAEAAREMEELSLTYPKNTAQ